jgi:CAAX protease family protein
MPEDDQTGSQVPEPASTDSPQPAELLAHSDAQSSFEPIQEKQELRGIAPIWHTVLLIIAILAFSIWGAVRPDSGNINPLAPVQHTAHAASAANSDGPDPVRVIRYALTGTLELIVVAWVAFGLRLRKTPFRSLFGAWPSGLNDITKEAAIAAAFWICSMVVLGSVAFSWNFVQTQIDKHHAASKASTQSSSQSQSQTQSQTKSKTGPDKPALRQDQADSIRQLMELAPASGMEIAAWGLLCLIVGFSEELIFRGYLQSQGIALLRRVPVSLLLTAIVFGAAHGYEGVRGIVIITVYGTLFGGITLLRRNLFPGMLAHAWHDFATGMALAVLRATHFLDHFPLSK